jgi:hypothetical protein
MAPAERATTTPPATPLPPPPPAERGTGMEQQSGPLLHESELIRVFNMLVDRLDRLAEDVDGIRAKTDRLYSEKQSELLSSVDRPFMGTWLGPGFNFLVKKDFLDASEPQQVKATVLCARSVEDAIVRAVHRASSASASGGGHGHGQDRPPGAFESEIASVSLERLAPAAHARLASVTLASPDEEASPASFGVPRDATVCRNVIDYLANEAVVRKFRRPAGVHAAYASGCYLQVLFCRPMPVEEAIQGAADVVRFVDPTAGIKLVSVSGLRVWNDTDLEALYMVTRVDRAAHSLRQGALMAAALAANNGAAFGAP